MGATQDKMIEDTIIQMKRAGQAHSRRLKAMQIEEVVKVLQRVQLRERMEERRKEPEPPAPDNRTVTQRMLDFQKPPPVVRGPIWPPTNDQMPLMVYGRRDLKSLARHVTLPIRCSRGFVILPYREMFEGMTVIDAMALHRLVSAVKDSQLMPDFDSPHYWEMLMGLSEEMHISFKRLWDAGLYLWAHINLKLAEAEGDDLRIVLLEMETLLCFPGKADPRSISELLRSLAEKHNLPWQICWETFMWIQRANTHRGHVIGQKL